MTFAAGSSLTVREMLHGRPRLEFSETVVADDGVVLATLLVPGTPLTFHEHSLPHPWWPQSAWSGTTVLMLRRPGDWYSVWRMFGTDGDFLGWYINFETPYVRGEDGIEVNDLALDIVVEPDGTWRWKDVEELGPCLARGRITVSELTSVLDAAPEVVRRLDEDDRWWSPWDCWTPQDGPSPVRGG